jgi:hypothetical protein
MAMSRQREQSVLSQTARLPWGGRVLLWLGLIMLLSPLWAGLMALAPMLREFFTLSVLLKAAIFLPWVGLALMFATVITSGYFRKRSVRHDSERDHTRS